MSSTNTSQMAFRTRWSLVRLAGILWICTGAGAQTLGTQTFTAGSAAGSATVLLTDPGLAWTAASNSSFLHLSTGSAAGLGSALIAFTYDAFTGPGTRLGTLSIAGVNFAVTQVGTDYAAVGPLTTLVSSGLNTPAGVAVDAAGNVYIADTDNNAIKEWNAATRRRHHPGLLRAESTRSAWRWTARATSTSRIPATTRSRSGTPRPRRSRTLVSSGLNTPDGVAVDGAGNVYIADTGNNAIKEWNAATQTVSTLVSSGLNYPHGVAVDGAGNVYIADYQQQRDQGVERVHRRT